MAEDKPRTKKPTEQEVLDRIKFASELYADARTQMDKVEELFTGEYVTKEDVKDQEIEIFNPPRAMAILFKFVSRLATRAEMGIQVVPRTLGEGEEEKCTILERWLEGYRFQAEYEAQNPIYRYFVTWFCLRGRGCLELRLRPQYAASGDYLAIRPIVADPKYISPVYGETGIMYYAKEYTRYVWDIKDELAQKFEGGGKEVLWKAPEGLEGMEATKELEVAEYWDRDWHAALIDKKLVFLKPNPYGFVPLVEAKAMDTPLESAQWASQSILHPLMNMLKKQAELLSKGMTGLEVFFYPWCLIQEPGGRSYIIESSPGTLESIPIDAKITVLNPTPNQQLLAQLGMMIADEINLMALPEISWGAEPGTLQSGRAISQVLAQTLDVIEDKRVNLERTLGWHLGGVLRMVEKFAGLAKDQKFQVMAIPEEAGTKRRDLVGVGAEEVDGHFRVLVNLSPPMPEDKMMRYEIARRAREIGKDGYPTLDDHTIISEILEMGNPDEIRERIEKQFFDRTSPEIMAYKKLKNLEEFVKGQKDLKDVEELFAAVQIVRDLEGGGMPGMEGEPGPGEGPGVEGEPPRPGSGELPSEEYQGPTEPGPEELALLEGA